MYMPLYVFNSTVMSLSYQSASEHEITATAQTGQGPFPSSNSPAWQAGKAPHLKTNLQPTGAESTNEYLL